VSDEKLSTSWKNLKYYLESYVESLVLSFHLEGLHNIFFQNLKL
jgi:hypothetical protein